MNDVGIKEIIRLLSGYKNFLESRKATNNFEREELFRCEKMLLKIKNDLEKPMTK